MTISSQTRKAGPFNGNDVTTAFPFTFKVFSAADVYVVEADDDDVESVLVLNSDYTVSLNANQNTNPGGTVTLSAALATGHTLVLTSAVSYLQPTDLTNQGGFYPKVINDALDRLTILVQQTQEEVDRSAKLPITSAADAAALVADIVLLADNVTPINTVAGAISSVQTVATNIADVNTVAGIAANVTTVAGIAANVTTVAGAAADVTTTAANIAAVVDAPNQAAAAAQSAQDAQDHYYDFRGVYYGQFASDPETDPNGDPPTGGDWYYNTTIPGVRIYNADDGAFNDIGSASLQTFVFTAAGGETSLSGNDDNARALTYTPGFEQVFLNGTRLIPNDDYAAASGSSITGLAALTAGDVVQIDAFGRFSLTDNLLAIFNNVAALRGVSGSASRDRIYLKCHATDGDGGHGTFRWVSGAAVSTYADNGGTIIVPTGGDGSAAWLREYSGFGSVLWFGAKGDGATDDTAALKAAILACDSLHWDAGTYLVDTASNALSLSARAFAHWVGYGATIKAKDGATATGNARMLQLLNSSNVTIEGLTLDGNRANRSSFAGNSHCLAITSGSNIILRDVTINNSCYDGIYIRAATPASEASYPTNLLFENVCVDNAYRNGLSIIGVKRMTIRGGRYTNTNGTAPQAGIDIEPNPSDTYSAVDILIDRVHVEGNVGAGISVTGNSGLPSRDVKITNLTGLDNDECLLLAGYCDNLIVDGLLVDTDSTAPSRVGLISILAVATNTFLQNLNFANISLAATKALVWTEGSGSITVVKNLKAETISCQAIYAQSRIHVDGVYVDGDTANEPTIYFTAGSYSVLRNADIRNKSGASQAIRINATFSVVDGADILDCNNGIRMQAANCKYRNITCQKTGTASGYAYYMDTATGVVVENVSANDVGGYWTNSTTFAFPGGLTSLAGATIRNVKPSPLRGTATWNPASVSSGAQVSTTVSVARADIGDFVRSSHSIALSGLLSIAEVTAANTVTVRLANLTGGNVDLGSHTVNVEVIK